MPLAAGTRLGTYEIVAPLGAGGMGEVYRAADTTLKRQVAIKVLTAPLAADPMRLARFQREAELLAALNHPNIAHIYGLHAAGGPAALVMELIEGPTLADRIAQGPLAIGDVLTVAKQTMDALDAAHERGIIHRDFKPANIKITPDGVVKVLDFGLAKTAFGDVPAADLADSPTMMPPTQGGVLLGTAPYMSPEQARGKAVDKRADIWAFGCVLYEMVSGRRPFAGETTTDVLARIVERDPDWSLLPAAVPPGLVRLMKRCLEKDLRLRLRDIGDARIELDDAAASGPARPQVFARSRTMARLWLTVILTSLIAAAALAWKAMDGRQTAADSAMGARFARVTADAAFNTEPALSRDGSLAVYASDRGGAEQLDLWVQRIAGGSAIRLTDDPADDREPSISPDGSLIAFRADRDGGGVYVIPALGGDARLVAERGRSPRFSPDGRRIAYWIGPWLGGPRTRGSAVFIVPAFGGVPEPIAQGFVAARNPVFSPDGRSLIFFGVRDGGSPATAVPDWWWIALSGGDPVPTGTLPLLSARGLRGAAVNNTVTPTPDALPVDWTEDGIVFSAALGDSVNLWRVKLSARTGAVVGSSLTRLTHGAGSDLLASADRTGRLAFQVSIQTNAYLTLPLDPNAGRALGSPVRQAADPLSQGRNSVDDAGRLMVYPKERASDSEIWVKDLATGRERHVATTIRSTLNPAIAHDGTKVAYTVTEGGISVGYVVPVAGGQARKVCVGCLMQGWLPDNSRVLALPSPPTLPHHIRAFESADGRSQDVVVDATSTIGRVDPTPDGRWIAFDTRQRVWIAPLRPGAPPDDSEWVPMLARVDSSDRPCGWSPDGRLLYLVLQRDGFRDLYAQRFDPERGRPAGDPFVVQHLHDPTRQWGSTPYGTAIVRNAFVFDQYESTGSIWLMDPRGQQ